jgi:hypothetical protein
LIRGNWKAIGSKLATSAMAAVLPVWFVPFSLPSSTAAQGANVPKDAWWNLIAAGLPVPPPTLVPDDAIAVGHNGVAADKAAAIGIELDAPAGSAVDTLTLTLKETGGSGPNIGSDGAAVVACPATGPWEPVHNGNWADVPTYDCELAKANGSRSPDGTWTFDLAGLGRQWLDPEFPLEQAGVVFLIEQAMLPVQVSFAGVATGEFRLTFIASAPSETEEPEPVVVGGLPAPEPEPAAAAPAVDSPPTDDEPAVLVTQPAQSQREGIREPNLTGNLPWGTWLLVPLALGGAAAVSYALGAKLRSGGGRGREGAVSRALSRQSADR